MTSLTKLIALLSFATFFAATAGCGRSDVLDYDVTIDGGSSGTDAHVDADADAHQGSGCTTNAGCETTPATPFCELPQGKCVACLTNPDTCPTGEACDPATHVCEPVTTGCTSNSQCPASKPICDTNDGDCVGCLHTSQCPSGDICLDTQCVPSCGGGAACTGGASCCNGGCVDEGTNPNDCGGCNNPCATGSCLGGICQPPAGCSTNGCTNGNLCCNDVCVGSETIAHCGSCTNICNSDDTCNNGTCVGSIMTTCNGGPACFGSETCCDFGCTDTTSDMNNCGGCNEPCECPPGIECACVDSQCVGMGPPQCFNGQICTGNDSCCDNGCTDTNTDPNNCSQCGFQCATGDTCVQGNCTAPANCDGGPVCTGLEQCCKMGCTDIDTDPNNCSSCGNVCPANNTCIAGVCTPNANCNGGPVCTGVNQCCAAGCTNIDTDTSNCGSCGNACGAGAMCLGGVCQIPPSCHGGPVCTGTETCCGQGCTDTTTDPINCGACNSPCPTGNACVGGVCKAPTTCNGGPACATVDTCCPSGCINTTNDANNCGGCGVICGGGEPCVDGVCTSSEGAFNPTVNPTYLAPGVHSYTSINIPAGVTVYVAGAGASSGTLSLGSTGDVVIAGVINLSGGPGTQNTITSQSTQSGSAGGGGFVGEPYMSAAPSAACSFVGGNGGSLGDAISGTTGSCTAASTTGCESMSDPGALLFTSPVATYGGGGGVFTGYRAYGAGGGGPAGGAPGALGAAYPGEGDCSGVSGGGGAIGGAGGAGTGIYKGSAGVLGQTQCPGVQSNIPAAYVGGGGGGAIGMAAVNDLAVTTTFQTGSSGGGGSADYLNRPVFGGTSGGGGGGGAIKLTSATTITLTGQILAAGGAGGDAVIGIGSDANCDPQPGAAGGGGSGGVIYLAAPVVTVASGAVVSTAGGVGGAGSEFATGGGGGKGGTGRIRLSVTAPTCATLKGSFTPPLPTSCAAGSTATGVAYIGTYPN